jgi:hypothetical protein
MIPALGSDGIDFFDNAEQDIGRELAQALLSVWRIFLHAM